MCRHTQHAASQLFLCDPKKLIELMENVNFKTNIINYNRTIIFSRCAYLLYDNNKDNDDDIFDIL